LAKLGFRFTVVGVAIGAVGVILAVAGICVAVYFGFRTSNSSPVRDSSSAKPSSTCILSATATAQFTVLHQGSRVSFNQPVAGLVAGIPSGVDAWLVVWPSGAHAYWPQGAPLFLDVNGGFTSAAQFGLSPSQDSGEEFMLMVVEASGDASDAFSNFINTQSQPPKGMPTLPSCTKVLAQVTVRRL